MTLVELMIGVTVIGIISLGFAGVFTNISKSLFVSKSRTLATNLAQEQVQILKQKSFYKILVTTATDSIPDLTEVIPYDTGYYPPENITEGSISFTRYTYVQVANENSGALQYFGAIQDTGMKAITVTVVWRQGPETKRIQLRSIVSNIDTTMSNAVFIGNVTNNSGGAAISGASVIIAENVGYQDLTNTLGAYKVNVSPGSYQMMALAPGFFPQYRAVSIAANQTNSQSFALNPMSSGTIKGSVWINDHLVISQIVGSTINAGGFCQEYVEIFNPSTYTWTMVDLFGNPTVDLFIQRYSDAFPITISMNYNTTTLDPGHYYLFANTNSITAVGVTRTADAVFRNTNAGYPNIIPVSGGGGCGAGGDADSIGLARSSTGEWLDIVGWDQNSSGHQPRMMETEGIDQNIGLEDGEQFIRKSSTSGVTVGIGRAYDSGNNTVDFEAISSPMTYSPKNSSDIEPVVAGVPAVGAFITAIDGLSSVTNAFSAGSPPVAVFELRSVATGTWSVFIASNNLYAEISSVTALSGLSTYIPNATTDPVWPLAGYYAQTLNAEATQGYIAGTVLNAFGAAISVTSPIKVRTATGETTADGSTGKYFLSQDPGLCDVTANRGNENSLYVSQSSNAINVVLGQVKSNINFILYQGGRIKGFATRDGTNPLPGISVIATDSNNIVKDQQVSGSDGRFLLTDLSTGIYTVEPVLGSGEVSTPISSSVTVTIGGTVQCSTFVITGTFGTIRGNVTETGFPIRSGVLLIASTATISTPPALDINTLSGTAYYMTNSYEDGTYALEVRGSTATSYNLAVYYPSLSGSTVVISSRSATGKMVPAGTSLTGVNFAF